MYTPRSCRYSMAIQLFVLTATVVFPLAPSFQAVGQELTKPAFGKLTYLESAGSTKLDAVNCITIDKNGKFLYIASWNAGVVSVVLRDPMTGLLSAVQDVVSPKELDGVTSIRLSNDGMYAVSAAFRIKAATLFKRDLNSGILDIVDVAREGENGVQGLAWAIDAAFSVDGRFVFVADPKGPGLANPNLPKSSGAIVVFEVDKDRLKWIETNTGEESCFAGVRGIAVSPDGKTLVAACSDAGSVVVMGWDANAKKTSIRQVILDEESKATALAGAMRAVFSADGTTLYVSSGRFKGDNAISVFRMDEKGLATFVQQKDDLKDFVGGNQFCLSPDERNLYAAATRSGSLACFERDLKTGELSYIETLSNNDSGFLNGAASVCVSPDGKHVYVTAELNQSIAIFERNSKMP